jgi:hypothetical protein
MTRHTPLFVLLVLSEGASLLYSKHIVGSCTAHFSASRKCCGPGLHFCLSCILTRRASQYTTQLLGSYCCLCCIPTRTSHRSAPRKSWALLVASLLFSPRIALHTPRSITHTTQMLGWAFIFASLLYSNPYRALQYTTQGLACCLSPFFQPPTAQIMAFIVASLLYSNPLRPSQYTTQVLEAEPANEKLLFRRAQGGDSMLRSDCLFV